jgi:peptide maturation system protein (TIGR04066 family)
MKQVVFFPYHPDILTLLSYKDMLTKYKLVGVVSFKDDHSLVENINNRLGIGDVPYEQLLSSCDTIVILDNYRGYIDDKYYEIIDSAVKFQKEILISPLAESQLKLDAYNGQYSRLELLIGANTAENNNIEIQTVKKLHDIDIPIMGIFGLGKNCSKFETLLILKRCLEKEYNILCVSSNALGALFDCYTMPAFLYKNISFQDKVIRLNSYINSIAKLADVDMIVLGVPEGIVPFEKEEFHHFAEYPLVVSSAVQIDSAVLCTYFMQNDSYEPIQKILSTYSDLCMGKFNAFVDMYVISKTRFELIGEDYDNIIYEYLDGAFLDKYYPNINTINLPLISLTNIDEAESTVNNCILRLQENVDAL